MTTAAEIAAMKAAHAAGQDVATSPAAPEAPTRRLILTPASSFPMKPTHWLWLNRIPLGELSLLAGREGIGKSTLAYWLVAWITTGTMKGRFLGKPRSVIIAATEDSWEHTIVPRLVGAGADLTRVFRCDVVDVDGFDGTLTLPTDVEALGAACIDNDVALILLDPLMSRLSAGLDSHKDMEVRKALEPLVRMAQRFNVSILGLIHVNKSNSNDALQAIMGSVAFAAVARAVLVAIKDPDAEGQYIFGLAKSNLGTTNQTEVPPYSYRVVGKTVGVYEGDDITTGAIEWLGDSARTINDAMEAASVGANVTEAVQEAREWLEDYLSVRGGAADSATVKKESVKAGHSVSTLQRARKSLSLVSVSHGMPRCTIWGTTQATAEAAVPNPGTGAKYASSATDEGAF
jgi:hypothetical protein